MKICLVVDDSRVVRKVARRILEGLDFEAAAALTRCTSRQCRHDCRFETRQDAGEPPAG